MRSALAILVAMFLGSITVSAQTTGVATANGTCSIANSGNNNSSVVINCGIGVAQGKQILAILNTMLGHQIDPAAVMKKLDEILAAEKQARASAGQITGSDNTVVNDSRSITGEGNTIVGADSHGNVIIPAGTAIGRDAHADPTSVAIGAGAGSGPRVQGRISQGDCGVVQVGGSGNVAAPCGPIERHLTQAQRDSLMESLQGKQIVVAFGTLYNVPDAQQYAFELCSAIQQAIPSTNCNLIDPYVEQPGHPWSGVEIAFKGETPQEGTKISLPPDTPAGMIVKAFVAAGIDRGVGHADPSMKEGEVLILVGPPPKPQ